MFAFIKIPTIFYFLFCLYVLIILTGKSILHWNCQDYSFYFFNQEVFQIAVQFTETDGLDFLLTNKDLFFFE